MSKNRVIRILCSGRVSVADHVLTRRCHAVRSNICIYSTDANSIGTMVGFTKDG